MAQKVGNDLSLIDLGSFKVLPDSADKLILRAVICHVQIIDAEIATQTSDVELGNVRMTRRARGLDGFPTLLNERRGI